MRNPFSSRSPKYRISLMGRPTRGIDSTDASKPVPAPHPTRPTRWSSRPRSTVRIESKVSLFSTTRRTSPSPTDSQCRRGTTLRQRRRSKERRRGPNRTVPTSRSSAFSSPNTSSDRSREGTLKQSRLWCNHRFTCSIVSSWDRVRPARGTQARSGCQTTGLRGSRADVSRRTTRNRGSGGFSTWSYERAAGNSTTWAPASSAINSDRIPLRRTPIRLVGSTSSRRPHSSTSWTRWRGQLAKMPARRCALADSALLGAVMTRWRPHARTDGSQPELPSRRQACQASASGFPHRPGGTSCPREDQRHCANGR